MNTSSGDVVRRLGGLGYSPLRGPYRYSGRVRIYRLELADEQLVRYRTGYLQKALEGTGIEVRVPEDDCILLVQNQFDQLSCAQRNGLLNERNVQFQLPVELVLPKTLAGEGVPEVCRASLPVFSHGAYMSNVITTNELRGPLMFQGIFNPPDPLGIDELNGGAPARLLTDMKALTTPAGPAGGALEHRSLLRVYSRCPPNAQAGKSAATDSGDAPASRLDPMDYFFNWVALKQFPDQSNPALACYQALEFIPRWPAFGCIDPPHAGDGGDVSLADYCQVAWDLADPSLPPEDRQRLTDCSIMIDASSPRDADAAEYAAVDVVKALGLATTGEIQLQERVGDRLHTFSFHEVKPTAYLCLDCYKDADRPVLFHEDKGNTLCYRVSTTGADNGWQFRPNP